MVRHSPGITLIGSDRSRALTKNRIEELIGFRKAAITMPAGSTKPQKGKGALASADDRADETTDKPGVGKDMPLQVRIPESVFKEFSSEAGEVFGFKLGAKKQMFLKIWEAYKAQKK